MNNHKRTERFEKKLWLFSASRESLMIPVWAARLHGWSSEINLAIYRRHRWNQITQSRRLP